MPALTSTSTAGVVGAHELRRKLEKLPAAVARKLQSQGTRKAAKVVADDTKRRVRVRSGLFKGAITVRALKRKAGRVGHRVTINTQGKGGRTKAARAKRVAGGFYSTTKAGKTYFYPAIEEYGAEGHPAQAPMRKSFDAKKDDALRVIIESIREGIRDATGK